MSGLLVSVLFITYFFHFDYYALVMVSVCALCMHAYMSMRMLIHLYLIILGIKLIAS